LATRWLLVSARTDLAAFSPAGPVVSSEERGGTTSKTLTTERKSNRTGAEHEPGKVQKEGRKGGWNLRADGARGRVEGNNPRLRIVRSARRRAGGMDQEQAAKPDSYTTSLQQWVYRCKDPDLREKA